VRLIGYLWALPVSLPAAGVALLSLATGGTAEWREGALESSGGILRWVLRRVYPPMSITAITLGHVILAQTEIDLERTRAHERIHVRQYERWGPFFPALYVAASLIAFLEGGDAYFDNRFEREARAGAPM
jgi:hypothetical protein